MPLEPLSHELNSFAARHGLTDRLTATAVVEAANRLAEGRFVATSVHHGRLIVTVPDAEARHLAQPTIPAFIAALNEALGQRRIYGVTFRLAADERQ